MFHADPHAGNVRLVLDPKAPGGAKPVLLDWGLIRDTAEKVPFFGRGLRFYGFPLLGKRKMLSFCSFCFFTIITAYYTIIYYSIYIIYVCNYVYIYIHFHFGLTVLSRVLSLASLLAQNRKVRSRTLNVWAWRRWLFSMQCFEGIASSLILTRTVTPMSSQKREDLKGSRCYIEIMMKFPSN